MPSGSEDYLGPPATSTINHPFYPLEPAPNSRLFSASTFGKSQSLQGPELPVAWYNTYDKQHPPEQNHRPPRLYLP
jgi:hypothetical protein